MGLEIEEIDEITDFLNIQKETELKLYTTLNQLKSDLKDSKLSNLEKKGVEMSIENIYKLIEQTAKSTANIKAILENSI